MQIHKAGSLAIIIGRKTHIIFAHFRAFSLSWKKQTHSVKRFAQLKLNLMNLQKMKRNVLSMLLAALIGILAMAMANAQQISPYLFGQNAWMPDSIGSQKFSGSLESHWNAVGESGATVMRYGGIGVDENKPTKYQYIKMIDAMRAKGMEPVVQVAFHKWQYTAQEAADIVHFVNITKGRNVKYWVIGNEPDLGYSYTTASQVASYIKPFASAMKAADPSIKIIGPECAWYNEGIINGLTTPGGPDDITGKDPNGRYYIDFISFHTYPMQAGSASRSQVITHLTAPGNFQDNLTTLNSRLANCNTHHGRAGGYVLHMAVTEINVNYRNPAGDNLFGNGASSFLGGQFWAEVLGIAMKKNVGMLNFWSTIEGNSDELNIGFLDRNNGAKKPSYYHFQMVAQNFRGEYTDATDNQPNVKAFGSKDGSQVAVLVLNQDAGTNFEYTVRLNGDAIQGTNALKINVSAGIAKEYAGSIENQSTQVLVFDMAGNLVKKIEYKLSGHASAGQPPVVTNFAGTGPVTGDPSPTPSPSPSTGAAGSITPIFNVSVGPNPTSEVFGFKVNTTYEEAITLRVYDMQGRLCIEEKNLTPNETNKLGAALAAGHYIAQIEQGKNKETIKLIKSN
jgi:hypothetical protein